MIYLIDETNGLPSRVELTEKVPREIRRYRL